MTDIYPQSEQDSHAMLQERHPLVQRVAELEQELANASMRAGRLRSENKHLEHQLEAALTTIAVISERLRLGDL